MEINTLFMRRALQLARGGALDASPNPMVGAVIVGPDGRVIGEGWHRRCGEGHAEVNAIASVSDPALLTDSTMYVTLEPCSHYGKTPPCADLIISRGIPRVVVGCLDPFPEVAGRGIEKLRAAGVEVVTGVLEKECRRLNEKFIIAHTLGRPFITVKWAESADGFIDGPISSPLTAAAVHRLRATHDAILVGSGTAIADRPSLTTRFYAGRSPLRVLLDRSGRVAPDNPIFPAVVFSSYTSLQEVVETLYRDHRVTSLLVEGGAKVIRSFLGCGLWDVVRIERGTAPIRGSVAAPLPPRGLVSASLSPDGHLITTIRNQSTQI